MQFITHLCLCITGLGDTVPLLCVSLRYHNLVMPYSTSPIQNLTLPLPYPTAHSGTVAVLCNTLPRVASHYRCSTARHVAFALRYDTSPLLYATKPHFTTPLLCATKHYFALLYLSVTLPYFVILP